MILAKLRMIKATVPRERGQKDRDGIRAILANTRISKTKVVRGARHGTTLDLLGELIPDRSRRKSVALDRSKMSAR